MAAVCVGATFLLVLIGEGVSPTDFSMMVRPHTLYLERKPLNQYALFVSITAGYLLLSMAAQHSVL